MMNVPSRLLSLVSLVLAASGQVQAADDAAAPPLPPLGPLLAQVQTEIDRVVLHGDFDIDGLHGEPGGGRIVKGAPYCADAVHETVQWLPDGQGAAPNRIVHQQTTRQCRDAEGRTRQELERSGRKLVVLRDPVAKENWMLDPEHKTARRIGEGRGAEADAQSQREHAERLREFARSLAENVRNGRAAPVAPVPPSPPATGMAPLPPVPPEPVIIRAPDGLASGAQRRVEIRVLRNGADVALEAGLPPPAVQWRAMAMAPRGAGSVSSLGARDIEGVRTQGERTTWTIDAGQIGNDKPIQITREVWTSPDLLVTVSTRDFDPRSGETSFRLKNLRRGEPDATLMRVPAEYSKPARPSPRASTPAG